jgi:hypothetical protein
MKKRSMVASITGAGVLVVLAGGIALAAGSSDAEQSATTGSTTSAAPTAVGSIPVSAAPSPIDTDGDGTVSAMPTPANTNGDGTVSAAPTPANTNGGSTVAASASPVSSVPPTIWSSPTSDEPSAVASPTAASSGK